MGCSPQIGGKVCTADRDGMPSVGVAAIDPEQPTNYKPQNCHLMSTAPHCPDFFPSTQVIVSICNAFAHESAPATVWRETQEGGGFHG